MPYSDFGGKRWSANVFGLLACHGLIGRVLDIGPGEGWYSMHLRQAAPEAEWTGVEVWGPYVKRFDLETKYDRVVISDARYVDLSRLGRFDFAFAGDVLEHMTKPEALELAGRLLDASRALLVSLPVVPHPQGESEGNPFERHVKDDWSHEEALQSLPDMCGYVQEGIIGVYVLSRDPEWKSMLPGLLRQAFEMLKAA